VRSQSSGRREYAPSSVAFSISQSERLALRPPQPTASSSRGPAHGTCGAIGRNFELSNSVLPHLLDLQVLGALLRKIFGHEHRDALNSVPCACVEPTGSVADLSRQFQGLDGDILPAARGREPRQAQPALAVAQLQLIALRSAVTHDGMLHHLQRHSTLKPSS